MSIHSWIRGWGWLLSEEKHTQTHRARCTEWHCPARGQRHACWIRRWGRLDTGIFRGGGSGWLWGSWPGRARSWSIQRTSHLRRKLSRVSEVQEKGITTFDGGVCDLTHARTAAFLEMSRPNPWRLKGRAPMLSRILLRRRFREPSDLESPFWRRVKIGSNCREAAAALRDTWSRYW